MTLTPWFFNGAKPVHQGWYLYFDGLWKQELMAYWNGKRWQWDRYDTYGMETYMGDMWCGLTERSTCTTS